MILNKEELKEYFKCKKDIFYFATHYCITEHKIYNGDGQYITKEELVPPYEYIKDMLWKFHKTGNQLHEKSRQMMWSWLAMVDTLHALIFQEGYSEKVISRKETLVDDGGANSTTDSLFGRLRFIWKRLPSFLKPPLVFTYLRVVNPITNSFVKGESTNTKAGRGGTYNKIKADEWAFVENGETIFAALKGACPNNIKLGSTPNGKGNNFARLRFGKNTGFEVSSYHWSLNPEKTQEVIKRETAGMTPTEIAREYELSYEDSVEGKVYYMFDAQKQIVKLEYNPNLSLFTAWDFGTADPTSILWIQENPNGEIYIIDEYENNNQEPPFYADIVKKKPYKQREADIGDPAGKARGVSMKSWISWLAEEGIHIRTPKVMSYTDRITTTRRIIPRIYVSDKCTHFLDAINNYKFPTDGAGRILSDKPIHNWASHAMTALEFYAGYRHPIRQGTWEAV